MDQRITVVGASLEDQNASAMLLRKLASDETAGRASANNDMIVCHAASSITAAPIRGKEEDA
jgi:hypothetical protein